MKGSSFLAGGAFAALALLLTRAIPPVISDEEVFRQVTLARRSAWAGRNLIVGSFVVQSSVSYMVVGTNTLAVGDAVGSLDTGAWGRVVRVEAVEGTGGTKTAIWVKWAQSVGDWPTAMPQAGHAFIKVEGREGRK